MPSSEQGASPLRRLNRQERSIRKEEKEKKNF
jgi:hypothetical protein